ncbi:MAG TPA: GNAT family N-acetyltransferase [Clostridiales bacterium]|nr:GNAT family N-acetyltransferase [Clostridiales bacterium]
MNANINIAGVHLETEDLILRPFKETDLNDFNEYAKVPGVGEMAGWTHHKSIDESKEILDLFIREKKTFAVVYKKSGKVIGSVGIENYDENAVGEEYKPLKCREIGFVLSEDYWGKGLMPQAVHKVLSFCFEELLLDAVFCGYFKRNLRSKRVAEKLGFKYLCDCKHTTRYDTQEDGVLTVIHKEDWVK